ncbi:MAG TPA: protein translocase SEC61 complex subunit gamma [Nanoarchaeota archaeon]|nr:protein translocase SEC61 complex subunit gamma [Nanoarchaeota archaeon]
MFISKIKEKLEEYRRVIRVVVKPTKEEFILSGKVIAIGVTILGAIGFIITLIFLLLRGG